MGTLFAAGAMCCAAWALYYLAILWREKKEALERIDEMMEKEEKEISWSDSLVDRLDKKAWARKLEPQLERACLNIRPTEYGALLLLAFGVIGYLIKWVLETSIWLGLLNSLVLTPIASRMFLKSRKHVYTRRIDAQLPESCRLLSSAARAGLSIPQGLEIVVQETPAPIKNELGTVVREIQLGRDLESTLRELLGRVDSRDMQLFVNALIIQRRAGGDLARVMSEMANTMEERKIIHKTIDSQVSQARSSAYMLPIMSVVMAFVLSKMFGGIGMLFNSLFGIVLLVIFVVFQLVGILLVRKISNIRI